MTVRHTALRSTPQATWTTPMSVRPWIPLRLIHRRALLLIVDLALVNAALIWAMWDSRLGIEPSLRAPLDYPLWFATLTVLWLLIATAVDTYKLRVAAKPFESVVAVCTTFVVTGIVYVFLPVVSPPLVWERMPILVIAASTLTALTTWRLAYAFVLDQPQFKRHTIIVGAGQAGRHLLEALADNDAGYLVKGFVDDNEGYRGRAFEGVPVLGGCDDLAELVKTYKVTDVVLAVTHSMTSDAMREVMRCYERGARIVPMPELYEAVTGRIPVEHIGDRWIVSLPIGGTNRGLYQLVKRIMDVAIAIVALAVWLPLFPFLAAAIYIESPGPIFYRPERLGKGGRSFRLWKLRTMCVGADQIGDPTFTSKTDSRVTHVGRLLRACHLDEFPQCLNILSGDMSAIGPRPERYVPELEEAIPFYRTRYAIRPGMTGWALVQQGYAHGIDETLIKLQYDLYYIKHRSLPLDLLIIVKTAIHMIMRKGQ